MIRTGFDVVMKLPVFESLEPVFELGDRVERGLPGSALKLPCVLRDGVSALRAVVVVRGDRLGTVAAPTSSTARAVLVGLDHAGLLEDRLVVLLGSDVLVRLPHVRVNCPVDAMLDLCAVVPLSTHARDGAVTEVVRVHRLLDAGPLGNRAQKSTDGVGRDSPVTILEIVAVTGESVDERSLRLVRTRMSVSKVGPQRRFAVDERVLVDGRPLQSSGVLVRRVRREGAFEVDVLHTEGRHHRQPCGGVGEELDDGRVSEAIRRLAERVDVLGFEHVFGANARVGLRRQVVVLSPFRELEVSVKLPDDELDVTDGRVGEPGVATASVVGVVAEFVDVLVHQRLGQVDDRRVEPLGRLPEVSEIRLERPLVDVAVDLRDPALDGADVGLLVGPVVEVVQLPLEVLVIALVILDRAHNQSEIGGFHKTRLRENSLFGRVGFSRTAERAGQAHLKSCLEPDSRPANVGFASPNGVSA